MAIVKESQFGWLLDHQALIDRWHQDISFELCEQQSTVSGVLPHSTYRADPRLFAINSPFMRKNQLHKSTHKLQKVDFTFHHGSPREGSLTPTINYLNGNDLLSLNNTETSQQQTFETKPLNRKKRKRKTDLNAGELAAANYHLQVCK